MFWNIYLENHYSKYVINILGNIYVYKNGEDNFEDNASHNLQVNGIVTNRWIDRLEISQLIIVMGKYYQQNKTT